MILFIQLLYEVARLWCRIRKKKKSSFYTLAKKVVTRKPSPKNEIKTYWREFQQNFKQWRNICVRKYLLNQMFFPSATVPSNISGNIIETLTFSSYFGHSVFPLSIISWGFTESFKAIHLNPYRFYLVILPLGITLGKPSWSILYF